MIRACLEGEAEAWDELFERFYPAAGRFVLQLSPALSLQDIEEICQEVFISVIRNLAQFRGKSSFQTWLFRIASNKARDFIAKQRALKRGGHETLVSLDAETDGRMKLDPPAREAGPDGSLMSAERMQLLHEALAALGDPCREIIELRYFGDLSYEEISGELNLNPKTVSSRLSKCLDRLAEIARPRLEPERFSAPSV